MEFSPSFIAGVDAVGTALLHFVWQGAVAAGAYALLRPYCVTVSARYRLGFAMLVAMGLSPLITLAYLWPAAGDAASGPIGPLLSGTITAVADQAQAVSHLRDYLPWLVALWTCGVLAIALRSLWHWRRIQRLVHGASMPGSEWQARLQRLRVQFGIRRPVRLLVSARVATPMLVGWLKPVVLLPLSMLSGFSPHQIELIIAHELGHVRRWDYLANLFQVVVETVLFYHPAVHWISRDVRNAREACCDDLVLSLGRGNPLTYARALADLEELRQDLDVVAPALGAAGGVLLARIRRIVGVEHDPLPRNAMWPALLVFAATVLFAVRPHDSLPDISDALARIPVETLAIFSGNPRLHVAYDTPRHVSMSAPSLALQPTEDSAAAPTQAAAIDAVKIAPDKPRIEAFATIPNTVAPVRNLVATRAAPISVPAAAVARASTPARLQVVQPTYPARATLAGVEGFVELEYAIDANGAVSDIRVLRAQPEGVFDSAAISALAQWRFQPGTGSGARYVQNFAFTLHKEPGTASNVKCQQATGSLICRQFDE